MLKNKYLSLGGHWGRWKTWGPSQIKQLTDDGIIQKQYIAIIFWMLDINCFNQRSHVLLSKLSDCLIIMKHAANLTQNTLFLSQLGNNYLKKNRDFIQKIKDKDFILKCHFLIFMIKMWVKFLFVYNLPELPVFACVGLNIACDPYYTQVQSKLGVCKVYSRGCMVCNL